jgi:hypothetical protein
MSGRDWRRFKVDAPGKVARWFASIEGAAEIAIEWAAGADGAPVSIAERGGWSLFHVIWEGVEIVRLTGHYTWTQAEAIRRAAADRVAE